jgi:predicted helicase
MSVYAIQQYHKELQKIIHYGGTKKDTAIRNAFYNLLNDYAYSKDLMVIAEASTKKKTFDRSALEWILEQYKEKKSSVPTIGEKFNTYKFADDKEQVIDLLKRVCTVSVETMKVVREMEKVNTK